MTESLFNSENYGNTVTSWIGQIVDDSAWKENRPGEKYAESSEIKGFGYRYKVRIFGKHPDSGLSNDELPFADILYPVTSGSGHGSSFQTPNLRQGTFVYGVWKDGMDQTEPLILGCFGNNDQTKLQFSNPPKGFVPFSGLYGEQVPIFSIAPEGFGAGLIEGVGLGDSRESEADVSAEKDGKKETALPLSEKCAKSLDKTQTELINFIQKIEETQKKAKNWSYWATSKGSELASGKFKFGDIDIDISRTAQAITKQIKDIITGIRQYITEELDRQLSKFYDKLFPDEEKKLEESHKKVVSIMTCLFNKIIANLIKIIGDLLFELIGRYINVPLCAVENIIIGLISQLLGLILGTLSKALSAITSIIGTAIDLANDVLGFVAQILGLFICDEASACPENLKWSSWGGPSGKSIPDFQSIFNKVKSFSSSLQNVTDIDNFDFNLDFSSVFDTSCNVAPIFCGPPTVDFFGGGGYGASGNAIVSASGEILGIDILSSGYGYTSSPSVRIYDSCGRGRGAYARAIIGKVKLPKEDDNQSADPNQLEGDLNALEEALANIDDSSNLENALNSGDKFTDGVISIIVDEPGFDYQQDFDGSLGGDGRVFSTPEQTVVKRENGKYDIPYDSGEKYELSDGDTVIGPFVTESTVRSKFPTNSKGNYNVVLSMCRVEIQSTGVNYSPTDTIVVEPSNGAILEPVFGPFGSLIDINIINPGSGFKDRPNVYIKTETGYNANILPILCVNRIGDIPEDQYNIPFGEKIIKVVDCVGKP